MAKNITFLILYFIVNLGSAQDLKELYQEARETSNIELSKKVRDLAIENGDDKTLANTHFLLAYLYKQQDEFYEAVLNYVEAVKYYRKLKDFKSAALVIENLGVIYSQSGFKNTALDYYYDALYLKKQLNDSVGAVYVMYNIGQTYLEMDELDSALTNYNKALRLSQGLKYEYAGRIYNDMGIVYRFKEEFKEASKYYDLADQYNKSIAMQARTLNNRGAIYLEQGQKEKATEIFRRVLALDHKKIDRRTLAYVNGNLGRLQTKPDSAIHFYETSFEYLKEQPMTLMSEYYGTSKKLERLYKSKGDQDKADYYDGLQDTFTQELIALQEQLKNLYLRYQVEAATWRVESEEKTAELAQVNIVQKYVITGLSVAVGGLILLFLYTHRLKKNNDDLKGDNRQLQQTYERNRRLSDSILQRAIEVHKQINS